MDKERRREGEGRNRKNGDRDAEEKGLKRRKLGEGFEGKELKR